MSNNTTQLQEHSADPAHRSTTHSVGNANTSDILTATHFFPAAASSADSVATRPSAFIEQAQPPTPSPSVPWPATSLKSLPAAGTTVPLFSLPFSSRGRDAFAYFNTSFFARSTPSASLNCQPTSPPCGYSSPPQLPAFQLVNTAVFVWGSHTPESFTNLLDDTYSEVDRKSVV